MKNRTKKWYRLAAVLVFSFGSALLAINLYGLTRSLAPSGIMQEHLRFKDKDVTMSKVEFKAELPRKLAESDTDYAARLTLAIAATMAHIHWLDYPPQKFNQRVPIWENYILYFMGLFSGIPEYERYHFSNPQKSIERGIGICGDTSILLSQLLSQQGIVNKIVTYPGHVVVEAQYGLKKQLLDADYGVVLKHDVEFYHNHPEQMISEYRTAGFVNDAEEILANGLQENYMHWNGASHFITKKFYFEKVSYWLIWFIPVLLLIISCFFGSRERKAS